MSLRLSVTHPAPVPIPMGDLIPGGARYVGNGISWSDAGVKLSGLVNTVLVLSRVQSMY
jgi:hypothetical protein